MTDLAPFVVLLCLICATGGYALGFRHRERVNQKEWSDYQSFLREQRTRLTARFRKDVRA